MTNLPPSASPEAPQGAHARPVAPRESSPESARAATRSVLDDAAIRRSLMRIAHEIVESADQVGRLYLVAIPNGGVPLGRILAENLEALTGTQVPLGILDTTLYRDDLSTRGARPPLRRTEMPSSVDDRVVVLVEDVVNTGRTIRAAMDALMDFGRPSHVRVVALVDRGHRELPIKIDYVGKNIPTHPQDKVVFHGEGRPGRKGSAGDGAVDDEAPSLKVTVRSGEAGGSRRREGVARSASEAEEKA